MTNKDIIIEIKNLPPAAYDTMMDKIQVMSADLMRTMANYKHLLDEDSTIITTMKPSEEKPPQRVVGGL